MTWAAFAEAAPELATIGAERFEADHIVLVGTIRKDGTPRISPVEVAIVEGELLLGMMLRSRKALDLLRDPRCLVHNIITDSAGSHGEFKVRGRAREVGAGDLREAFAEAFVPRLGERPSEPYHLFAIEVEHVAYLRISPEDVTQLVMSWRAGGQPVTKTRRWTGETFAD